MFVNIECQKHNWGFIGKVKVLEPGFALYDVV